MLAMDKSGDSRNSRKKNYTIYHDAITVFGRNVLIKLLEWFYKGGETSYFDYISRRYGLHNLDPLIDDPRKYILKYKTPKEFDLTLLQVLLQLACNLYEEKTQGNKDDKGYEFIEEGILTLVYQSDKIDSYKDGLTSNDLSQKLNELISLYTELIKQGGRLSEADTEETNKFSKEISFGIMCLGHWVKNSEYSFEKVNAVDYDYLDNMFTDLLEDKFIDWMKKEEIKEEKQKKKDKKKLKKEADGKTLAISSSSAKEDSDKGSSKASTGSKRNSGMSASAEKQTSPKKSVPKTPSCVTSSETKSFPSQTEAKSVISDSRRSVEESMNTSVKKSKKNGSSPDNSTSEAIPSRENIQSRICGAIRHEKSNKLQKPGVNPLSLYMYTNIFLKQHGKYSREPGRQVRLEDLFNVKGMNSDNAEIIILSGDAGMGKTWLMQYILEKWTDDQTAVDKLGSCDWVIPYELQKNCCSNFTQLISSLLKDKVGDTGVEESLKETVLGLSILVTLDGYDESGEKSCQLIKEVLQMSGKNLKVIVTSRPQYVDTLYQQIPKPRKKHVSHLCLNSIPRSHHADFVMGMINSKEETVKKDSDQLEEIKAGLINRLPEIYDAIGEDLCNPLMLKIITAMWIEHSQIESNVLINHL